MSKKSDRRDRAAAAAASNGQKNQISGLVLGVIAALVIFSLSGGGIGSGTKSWVEGTGTITEAYTISQEESKQEAGMYAVVSFTDGAGAARTERAKALKSDLADYVGDTVTIKYNPDGDGVLIKGNEKSGGMSITALVIAAAAFILITKTSNALKNYLQAKKAQN